jgi:hypothetical protein
LNLIKQKTIFNFLTGQKRSKSFFFTIPQIPQDFEKFFFKDPNTILFDKTQHVAELMMEKNRLIHFNRPRKFGKFLMMDALQHFYLKGIHLIVRNLVENCLFGVMRLN